MAVRTEMKPHAHLRDEQLAASNPRDDVWLSASAGTGKTYVLSARVLRLLLRGARPDSILALTFTKAGAAEMAERVHQRLAHWVQLPENDLRKELFALGESSTDDVLLARARTLFASALEARGGGLRIMTIHAFCHTLLAGFPLEAGLSPGFRPIEGREEAALAQSVLSELVIGAEREGDARLIEDLRSLSRRLGEDEARRYLLRAARAGDALEALPSGLEAVVRGALGVPLDFDPKDIPAGCCDTAIDRAALIELAQMHSDWGTATGERNANAISEWLLGTNDQRANELRKLSLIWNTEKGTLRKGGPKDAGHDELVSRLAEWCAELHALAERAELAGGIASALNAGRRYARAYAEAKRARGLVDFDDLIRKTRDLLLTDGMGDWIRYKLDQATDHILVDEAQDTNSDQWTIVAGLASEFYAGEGARGDALRTIFTVGDFKQAIFGFQGTNPLHFEGARKRFAARAEDAGREIMQLSLNRSFRSSPPVLDVVDALLGELGAEALGLSADVERHVSARGGAGEVMLLAPVTAEDDSDDEDGEEGWVATATRKLADKLAKQVKAWLDEGLPLSGGRVLQPQDVMILVRKRGDLAALLVARLHAAGVPVAGVDRLRLKAPQAVRDLLAAMRFAVQPGDELNLAALLVSPLMGWTQEELFAGCFDRKLPLWQHLRGTLKAEALEPLYAMLRAADLVPPFVFLEQLLSGPLQGRKKLLARLGKEARDPIDELLNAALQFEGEGIASLQIFLDWFDRGEGEIVRDAMGGGDAVRVMTVHGAKGLQAPLVILADAAGDPDKGIDRNFEWLIEGVADKLPLFRPRASERLLAASLEDALKASEEDDRKEHWRLLYVAMTRAEERLVVAGSLGASAKGVPAGSWHAAVGGALRAMGVVEEADAVWGTVLRHKSDESASRRTLRTPPARIPPIERPDWLDRAAPVEARPPRPLAPSSLGKDDVSSPPSAAMARAADRGKLVHSLFERLPALAESERRAAAMRWLGEGGEEIADAALRIIGDPEFARIFAADSLAEAPIAGVVDGVVVSGVVDRLAVSDDVVELVDFKTGRRVPRDLAAVPEHHVRQMAAYAAVLAGIFPGREVRAALLYTEGPVLHRLPPALLEAHKPGLVEAEEELGVAG